MPSLRGVDNRYIKQRGPSNSLLLIYYSLFDAICVAVQSGVVD